jgi:hypothetical protein
MERVKKVENKTKWLIGLPFKDSTMFCGREQFVTLSQSIPQDKVYEKDWYKRKIIRHPYL